MDDIESADDLEAISNRIDIALSRLENGINLHAEQIRIMSKLQSEIVTLKQQKNEINGKFEHSLTRMSKLDKGANEVSLRLVDAMETIRSVLVK